MFGAKLCGSVGEIAKFAADCNGRTYRLGKAVRNRFGGVDTTPIARECHITLILNRKITEYVCLHFLGKLTPSGICLTTKAISRC
jgi:hypothetical protein